MLSIESGMLVKVLASFGVILILIFFLTWIMKKLNLVSARIARQGEDPRLSIKEVIAVDHKRRLLLVRRDDVEHLLMIGGEADLVVEQGIPAQMPHPHAAAVQGKATPTALSPVATAPAQPHQPPQPPMQPRMAPPRPLSGQPYSPALAHSAGQAPQQSQAAPQMVPSYGNQPSALAPRPHDAPPSHSQASGYSRPAPQHTATQPKGPKLHQPQYGEPHGRDPLHAPAPHAADARQAPRYGRSAAPMPPLTAEQTPPQSPPQSSPQNEEASAGRAPPQAAPEAAAQPASARREPQTPAHQDAPSADTAPTDRPVSQAKRARPAEPTDDMDMDKSKLSAPVPDDVKAPEMEGASLEDASRDAASAHKPADDDEQAAPERSSPKVDNRPQQARPEQPAPGLRPLAESASYDDEINRLLNELSSEIKK